MACLVPVAAWILVSGLDDLFITLVYLLNSRRRFPWPADGALRRKSERPIAILIPLWREQGVIGQMLPLWFWTIYQITFLITLMQLGIRTQSAARIYGWGFAAGVPLRIVWGNMVNFAATSRALGEFGLARWAGVGIPWKKTEHAYPDASLPAPSTVA